MSYNIIMRKFVLVLYSVLLPVISFADTHDVTCTPGSGKICNPLSTTNTIPELIQKILEGVLKVGIPIVALAIIYCGFLFVAAQGQPEKITKARAALGWTLVGAAILLGSWAIAEMIGTTIDALK